MMEERSHYLQIMLQSRCLIQLCFDGLSVYIYLVGIVYGMTVVGHEKTLTQ
jgi:hypothetical protein